MWKALWFTDAAGQTTFGIGVGTLMLAVEHGAAELLHARLPLVPAPVGGVLDQFSKHPARLKMYDAANCLNCRHMKFAWASLFSVALADLYVRLCSMGVLTDWRLI